MLLTSLMRIWLTRSFKPFHFTNRYSDRLELEDLQTMGLYVHIPFCRSLCGFCPYCKVIFCPETAAAYKTALLKEIDLVGTRLKKKRITSLYFGGGTPVLMLEHLEEIIAKLRTYFIIQEGIGVELHPEDITQDNLNRLKQAGVSMVSIGFQSFEEKCLRKLGRSGDSFVERLRLVKKAGFDAVDVDLIFAIPGQTGEIITDDIKTAFDNGATQISTYPFIDFTFADNRYKPMPERVKKDMLKEITEYCESIDAVRTSVWTFAKHNTKKYSSVTRDNFLGLGVSAATLLKDSFKINTFSIEDYISRTEEDCLPTSLTLNFTRRQRAVYYLFWSAYSMRIYPDKFEEIIGKPLHEMYGFEFRLLELLGLIHKKEDYYALSERAAYLYHYIEQTYTTAYIDKMWNVSGKIAFPEEMILK
ncbi:oxygen-independent coproporphyrinogen-3 oxidase [Ruminiclostridium sufflavum DSM 19573]|uniref:Heme chaperone HemW n=1 Tax=Ruminiclostridium sufflavum DSM 19573 TaxID=1121337 RepID=A0A318Y6K3_9FIRM|nr:radical SAM protein [Ruminiclostridium sufflavum]PYG87651.1 oxygen-independent coproporphyrinogen-3 oxidase [Ruminiclostridium sufflavum DSM 19573]